MNKLIKVMNSPKMYMIVKIVLIICIIMYPFLSTFIGIELGDTGLHTFTFTNLYSSPELIGFTSYFTSVVGWIWLQIFGDLGLWGLNLLEFIIEMLMAFIVFRTFKSYLGECCTLLGILVSVVASGTYLNVFNYHQFNVFLLVVILCFEFKANQTNKIRYSIFAGVGFSVVVFARIGSVTAIVTLFTYFFWYWMEKIDLKSVAKHLVTFLLGASFTTLAMIGLLNATGQIQYFINNIFRLSGMASATEGGYSMNNLWQTFFEGNLDAIASGMLFLAASIILLLGMDMLLKKQDTMRKKVINVIVSVIAIFVAMYQLVYAYDVNPVPSWPQMTTGPSYVIGVLYVVTFMCIVYHIYSSDGKREIAFIAVEAVILPLLTIAGSNTGTKHVIIGLWIIAPIACYTVVTFFTNENSLSCINKITSMIGLKTNRISFVLTAVVLVISFGFKFAHMAYFTTNFDSIDRSSINSTIKNDKVKFLKTTEREANSINGVLEQIDALEQKSERPLMVFGGSLLFYYMTGMESYVQPWFSNTNYADKQLEEDLENAKKKFEKLPIVIYGRTNNYYGFYESDYEKQITNEMSMSYSGKKQKLIEFLDNNDYNVHFVNDYYVLIYPPDISITENKDYRYYITGET